MTYNIANNAGDSSLKSFLLYELFLQQTYGVSGATNASPIVITTTTNCNIATGTTVTVQGVTGNIDANCTATATYISPNSFSLDYTNGSSGYSGRYGFSGVSGVSGFSGNSGYSGYSGVFGYSGISGYCGFPPNKAFAGSGFVIAPATLRWTDSDIPIAASGYLWTPQGISLDAISAQQGTAMTNPTLTIQDADLLLASFVYNPITIRNAVVNIYEAWFDPTASTATAADVGLLFGGRVQQAAISKDDSQSPPIAHATIVLQPVSSLTACILPRRLCTSKCTVIFKGPACGYSGPIQTCDHTLIACTALGNNVRYGGFPGLPDLVSS